MYLTQCRDRTTPLTSSPTNARRAQSGDTLDHRTEAATTGLFITRTSSL